MRSTRVVNPSTVEADSNRSSTLARILIILWLSPIVLFALWIGLSTADISLGLPFMTREVHDLVFQGYQRVLGLSRIEILTMLQQALWLDVAILAALIAWRRRDQVAALYASASRSFESRSRQA